jgi:hypothetical protein
MKKLLITAGLLSAASLAGTSAALAQSYVYYGAPAPYGYTYGYPYGSPGYGYYDYAPGYSGYGYGGDNFDNARVNGPGRGNSAESQR